MNAKLNLRHYQVKIVAEGALEVELLAASAEEARDSALAQAQGVRRRTGICLVPDR